MPPAIKLNLEIMMSNTLTAIPTRILHIMLRVNNIEQSLRFYCDALGMKEMRRETFPEGEFTLVFVGYGNEEDNAVIELTYNWKEGSYAHGTRFGHIAVEVPDAQSACERLARMGVEISRPAGPMTFAPTETGMREVIAFVMDPDGYRIELIEPRPV